MKQIIRHRRLPIGLFIALSVLALFVAFGLYVQRVSAAPTADVGQGQRLLTVFDRGEERVFLTDASTVGEALERAEIELSINDTVEPNIKEELVASSYNVNIYRARPVVVIDGAVRQKVMTPYQTPELIAKSAGVTLYPEDETNLEMSGDIIGDGVGLEMSIDRATLFTFVLYGKSTQVRTQAVTVGELLDEKGIKVQAADGLSTARTSLITSGMKLELWRDGVQTLTEEATVEFETEKIQDADRAVGYREVKTVGEAGTRNVTYQIDMKNGIEVSRTEIASITTKEPVKQVEIVGAKLPVPTNPSENAILGHQMMLDYGFGEDQWPCLYNLWMRESGWRTNAGNQSSGAYGIPQSLPASKMASAGADYLTSAATQITWGLGYVKGRYGTPCGAYAQWQSHNWY